MREHWQPTVFDSLEQGSQVRALMAERAKTAWLTPEPSLLFMPPSRDDLLTRLPRPLRVVSATLSVATSLALAACGPTPKPSPEVQQPASPAVTTTSEISFGYPFSGLWYFNAGPHSDGLTKEVRAALDFGPPEVVDCPGRKPLEDRFVEASAAGKVAIVGNERDATDQNHSIVEIDHNQGLRTGYMHLANISVNVGQEVKQGQRLGNPSCEIPPGGATSGIHLHWYVKKDGKFVPADGIKFPQGQIKAGLSNKDGTLIGPNNLVRTADERRCGPNESSIIVCDGKRNDLNTGAVLGEAVKVAPPLPTIATAKPAPPAPTREVPKPTVKPTLTPKLKVLPVKTENLDKLPERTKLVEEGWKWIRIQMVLENTSQQELLIFQSVFNPGLSKFKITTAEGFTYGVPHCYDEEEGLSLPPTFRVRGHVLPGQATWERRLLEICSKVPTLSTDYILRHPDSSEINVTKSFVDPDKLRYPTDRPDSDFSKVGTIFNIPNKGTATIVDLSKDNVETSERRRYGGSSSDIVYKLTARFINTNKGQDNYFVITIGRVFGTDGFIYRPRWADDQSSSYANTLGGTVGPSLTKDFKKYFVLPGQFPGGKFPVGGDIETIFNFDAK